MILTIENRDRLQEFTSDSRAELSEIFHEGDYSYAASEIIVVRIKERYKGSQENTITLRSLFEGIDDYILISEISIEHVETMVLENLKEIECESCNGKGYFFSKECPECFGNGVFHYREKGNTSWEGCSTCQGSREIFAKEKDWNRIIKPCEECFGRRYNWNFRVRISEGNDIGFGRLRKIFSAFRKIELFVSKEGELEPIGFKTGEFEGIIMPLRPAESNINILDLQNGVFKKTREINS